MLIQANHPPPIFNTWKVVEKRSMQKERNKIFIHRSSHGYHKSEKGAKKKTKETPDSKPHIENSRIFEQSRQTSFSSRMQSCGTSRGAEKVRETEREPEEDISLLNPLTIHQRRHNAPDHQSVGQDSAQEAVFARTDLVVVLVEPSASYRRYRSTQSVHPVLRSPGFHTRV